MASIVQTKIVGVDQIVKALKALPEDFQKSGERAALSGGSKPILKAAKAFAQNSKRDGLLIKSLGISTKKSQGQLTSRVGVRGGFKGRSLGFKMAKRGKKKGQMTERFADPKYYAHLVEFGTSHSAAKPIIRPAIIASEAQVVDAMAASLEKSVARTLARMKKK